jgi:hypothetical protein
MRVSTLLLSAALLYPATGTAEPRLLSDSDLGEVTGGLFDFYVVMPVVVVHNNNNAVATGVHSQNVSADAVANINVDTIINLQPSSQVGSMGPVFLGGPLAGSIGGPIVFAPSQVGSPFAGDGAHAPMPPVWVPWAAELRGALGIQ